jgi:hypothetical protein
LPGHLPRSGAKRMSQDVRERQRNLENAFFLEQNRELLEKLKADLAGEEQRQALADASGIVDQNVLSGLAEQQIGPQTLAALSLVPLIQVAWADRVLEDSERDAVLKAAKERGLGIGAFEILKQWLETRPDEGLYTAWHDYTVALVATLDDAAKQSLKDEIIGGARQVAEAAGGFLGIGKTSGVEQEVLTKLEKTFE